MTEPTDGRNVSAAGCVGTTARSNDLISAGPNDLVVLRALGKHQRMAKTIRRTTDGRSVIEAHDGRKVFHVSHARTLNLDTILQGGRGLATIDDDEFVIRGAVRTSANPRRMRRLLHPKDDSPATLAEVPRAYVIFDIDGANPPIDFDPRNQLIEEEGTSDDPAAFVPWEAAIDEFIRAALPAPFHGTSCWWQFTASMGFKPGLHMHLLFILDKPMTKDALDGTASPLAQTGSRRVWRGPADIGRAADSEGWSNRPDAFACRLVDRVCPRRHTAPCR